MKIAKKYSEAKLNVKFTVVIITAIVIPIAIFAGVLFRNQEQYIVNSNVTAMEYKRELSIRNINTCIDSINMATQYFLSDEEMANVLVDAHKGKTLSAEELVKFQEGDITNLERLVSNNPLLYSVRIFAENDNVQEMMQILYTKSRSESLEWNQDNNRDGWHFQYKDTAFSSYLTNQNDYLLCLVTPINDYKVGEIGIVEASMKMSTMFPSLYEESENEWSCFMTDDGEILMGVGDDEDASLILQEVFDTLSKSEKDVKYVKINKRKVVVARLQERELGGQLVFVRDITDDVNHVLMIRNIFIVIMIIILIGITFLINMIVIIMLRQFYSILKSIREVQHGNLDERIEHCSNDEMGELGTQLNTMLDRVQKLMEENIGREVMVKDSEIRALQNQINAHFIYNVLESIKMMAEIDEEYEISDAITSLGRLLRYSMRWVSGNVKVEEELDYIKNYMSLINLRYDFVVNLSINIPENILLQEIPKMSLQPIVENAILHGIEPTGNDSTIYIKGMSNGKDCVIEITDTGKGMTEEERLALEKRVSGEDKTYKEKGNGIGLNNVQKRIKMAFGEEYGMTISSQENCFTKVSICLPYRNVING